MDYIFYLTGEQFYMTVSEDSLGWCKGRKSDGTDGLFPRQYAA